MSRLTRAGALFLLVAIACEPAPTVTEDPVTELLPLAVGSEWTYSHADSGEGRSAVFDSVNVMRVLRDTVAMGRRWYLVERNEMIPSFGPVWFANTSGGLHRVFTPGSAVVWVAYQHPPVLGHVLITPSGQIRAFVLDTTISVPAGTFRCLGYEWVSNRQDGTLYSLSKQYVCPGVGLVKEVSNRLTLNDQVLGWRVKNLTSFRP